MDVFLNQAKKLRNWRVKKNLKTSIEPEEIFPDAAKPPELENQKIEVPIRPKAFRLFGIFIAVGFLILAGRTAYLQIIKGAAYQQLAERNRTRSFPIFAARGIIYDKNQNQLVYNIPSFDLVATLQDLPREQVSRSSVIDKAAAILGVSAVQITDQLNKADVKTTQSILVASNLEHEQILALEAQLPDLPGFRIEKNSIRQYVDGPYFSHILGYMGKLEAQDLEKNPDYFMTEKIGKDGLEYSYEEILRGHPGKQVMEVDSQGREKGLISQDQPQDGSGLILTIDSDLQKKLYDSLTQTLRRLNLKKAVAVAINPNDGGVLALISLPGFDNNLFAKGISSRDYEKLENDPATPFLNRVIAGQYAPGSTIKPLIGAVALQEKVITPATKINDFAGELVVPNQYNPQIVYHYPDWKTHGIVDIYSAIAQSCDVFFYTVGGGYGNIEGLGVDRLVKYFKLFGLGAKLGIDLPGESEGLVSDEAWKLKSKNETWYTGDTYHLSIGQGDLLVTPLQLAAATVVIANGGQLWKPRLVDKIVDSDKNIIKTIQLSLLRENFISKENIDVIKKAMRQTVTAGSALLLNGLRVPVAAKTGTAQVVGQSQTNGWVAVFGPYPDPEIVLVIMMENAGEGSSVAVPVAKDVLDWYFNK